MKELPKVYATNISKEFHNTQDLFYGNDRNDNVKDTVSVIKKINNIFSSSRHVYKSRVKITLNDRVVDKVIVGKTNTDLITIDGELIKIINILDIKQV